MQEARKIAIRAYEWKESSMGIFSCFYINNDDDDNNPTSNETLTLTGLVAGLFLSHSFVWKFNYQNSVSKKSA